VNSTQIGCELSPSIIWKGKKKKINDPILEIIVQFSSCSVQWIHFYQAVIRARLVSNSDYLHNLLAEKYLRRISFGFNWNYLVAVFCLYIRKSWDHCLSSFKYKTCGRANWHGASPGYTRVPCLHVRLKWWHGYSDHKCLYNINWKLDGYYYKEACIPSWLNPVLQEDRRL
jgi:hypothetical protein